MSEELRGDNCESKSPKWMDDRFFEKALIDNNNNEIAIKSFVVSSPNKEGEHCCSEMFRAVVRYEADGVACEKSLIIKTMPTAEGEKSERLKDMRIFETEIKMYTEVIPKYEALLRENGDDTVFGPKVFYASLEPVKVIVFEDLAVRGYRGLENFGAPDEESNLAVLKLAKWHALSLHLHQEQKELFESIQDGLLKSAISGMPFFTEGIELFCTMLRSLEGCEEYVDKFDKLRNSVLIDNCKKIARSVEDGNPCKIFVLNHGDFHAKNVMFKYTPEPNDAMLVDYQVCFWGPAAFDVIYFLYMIYRPESRINNREAILHLYFNQFLATLDLIHFKGDRPTFADLEEDIFKCKDFELLSMMTSVPIIHKGMGMNDEDGDFVLENALSADFRAPFYKLKSYVDDVRTMLPVFKDKHYLD